MARMVIPINFTDENDYKYVKNQPNSSYYIRELVKKDRLNQQNDRNYIDKKIEELESRLKNLSVANTPEDKYTKKILKNILDMY